MPGIPRLVHGLSASTGGNIVGDSNQLVHNFGPSSVWAYGVFQSFSVDGSGGADIEVVKFTDANGTHKGSIIGQFATKCTSVTYQIDVSISAATALCITEFFD